MNSYQGAISNLQRVNLTIARSIKNFLELQTKTNRMHPGSGTINLIISTSKLPFLGVRHSAVSCPVIFPCLFYLFSFFFLVRAGRFSSSRTFLLACSPSSLVSFLVLPCKTNGLLDIDNRLRYETNGAQRFVIRLAASESLQPFRSAGKGRTPVSIFSLKRLHASSNRPSVSV